MIKESQDKEFLKRELAWKVCRWFVDNPAMLSDTILRIVYKNARKALINFFKDYYPCDSKNEINIIIDMIVDTMMTDSNFYISHEVIQLFKNSSG